MTASEPRWTYGGDPSAAPRDAVRFLVGDTNKNRPLLDDREVDHAIAKFPDENLAAAFLCEHLFGLFASKADFSVGPVSKSYSKVAELFDKKSKQLRSEAVKFVCPSFPATTYSEKDKLRQDDDLPNPSFAVGMFDDPEAIQLNDELDRVRFYGFLG